MPKILLKEDMRNPDFDSPQRAEVIDHLRQFGNIEFYAGELTGEDADDVIGVIASGTLIHTDFYKRAIDLRIVARWGVGYEKTNIKIATDKGVFVTFAAEHLNTVAEYTVTQLLAALKRVYTLNQNSHAGDWTTMCSYEAEGSTLGLYGFGRIGQHVAQRVRPLIGNSGRLLVYDVRPDIEKLARKFGAETVNDPTTLFRECDAVSLHVSGADIIVRYAELCAMKPHASLINPSRGALVNDEDMHRALAENRLYYYIVDDPPNDTRAIHKDHPRVICTNHNAGLSAESTIRMDRKCADQTIDAIEGRKPENILNPDVLMHPRIASVLKP